ncbi:MAG: hypothetical protein INR70_44090 [Parafilimonas terrae]|nr:hypothetical protein [Parafilimonas terrae]
MTARARWYGEPDPSKDPSVGPAMVAANLGQCLTVSRWPDALALVAAVDPAIEKMDQMVATRAENAHRREAVAVDAALSRLVPGVAACVPAGVRLRMDRVRLRSVVEEAVYHVTEPPAAGF